MRTPESVKKALLSGPGTSTLMEIPPLFASSFLPKKSFKSSEIFNVYFDLNSRFSPKTFSDEPLTSTFSLAMGIFSPFSLVAERALRTDSPSRG